MTCKRTIYSVLVLLLISFQLTSSRKCFDVSLTSNVRKERKTYLIYWKKTVEKLIFELRISRHLLIGRCYLIRPWVNSQVTCNRMTPEKNRWTRITGENESVREKEEEAEKENKNALRWNALRQFSHFCVSYKGTMQCMSSCENDWMAWKNTRAPISTAVW